MCEQAEPAYVCFKRLLFEEKNAERYGWDLGVIHPFVSTAAFYWDVATLPYHLFTAPCRKFECSAGYCLPGDPVPYLLYPPEWSLTGLTAEALAVYSLALVPTAVCTYLATGLYAMLRMRLLLALAIFILLVKALFAVLLLPPLAHQGVALSHGLSYLLATPLTVLAVWWALREQVRREAQS